MDVNVTIRIDRIDDLIKAAGMLAGLHGEEASPAQKPYSARSPRRRRSRRRP